MRRPITGIYDFYKLSVSNIFTDWRAVDLSKLRVKRSPKMSEVKILRKVDITSDLMLAWIEKPEGFVFKAGQYCTIGSGGIERAYSIVSAPHEDDIELFLELVPPPEGNLTPKLWELEPGDTLSIRPRAKGIFTFKPDFPNQFLVSTVTGVVPYISFIRDYLNRGLKGHHFHVLQGASYFEEFTYKDELERYAQEFPELVTYVPTVSRPKEKGNRAWTGTTGRVNDIVENYVEKYKLTPDKTLVYACGHPGMIENVKERLIPKDFRVEEERFWKQD